MRIGLVGFGRMGQKIAVRIMNEKDMTLAGIVERGGNPFIGKDAGYALCCGKTGVIVQKDLAKMIENAGPDVIVDFTSHDACAENVRIAAEKKVNVVIGTTGFGRDERKRMDECITRNRIGAVISPNMSVGVNVFWKLAEFAAKHLDDCDIEIIEAHHRMKKDAPSGTALKTAEIVKEAAGGKQDALLVYGRKGVSERKKNEIGIHAVRAGDIVGDHTVLYCSEGERIEITHRAHSRDALVNGVISAIRFIRGKKGIYDMSDVLRL